MRLVGEHRVAPDGATAVQQNRLVTGEAGGLGNRLSEFLGGGDTAGDVEFDELGGGGGRDGDNGLGHGGVNYKGNLFRIFLEQQYVYAIIQGPKGSFGDFFEIQDKCLAVYSKNNEFCFQDTLQVSSCDHSVPSTSPSPFVVCLIQ